MVPSLVAHKNKRTVRLLELPSVDQSGWSIYYNYSHIYLVIIARQQMKSPKEREMGAGEFKTHCLQLIDEVNQSRVAIIVTKHGKPLAKLVPYSQEMVPLFGCMQDSVVIHGNIVASTGEAWEADGE
jgi:prevent-host-death family protein